MKTNKQHKPTMKSLFISLAVLATALAAHAQSWTNRFDGPMAGNDTPTGIAVDAAGNVLVNGTDPANLKNLHRLGLVALVPQRATDLLFLNSVSAELCESDAASGADVGSTAKILEKLTGRIDPTIHPRDLSAGQKLALVLAIQLVKDAPLLLLDEPTQGLDYGAKEQLANLLNSLAAEGKAIVVATHDLEFAAQISDQTLDLGSYAN